MAPVLSDELETGPDAKPVPLTMSVPPARGAAGEKTTEDHLTHAVSAGPQQEAQVALGACARARAGSSAAASAAASVAAGFGGIVRVEAESR